MYSRVLIAGFVALNGLCASAGVSAAASVPVYDPTQLALGGYAVLERINVQGWQSAFNIPGHPTEDAARDAVLAQAGRLGADGVTNLKCMSQTDSLFKSAGYYCYANAIKLKKR